MSNPSEKILENYTEGNSIENIAKKVNKDNKYVKQIIINSYPTDKNKIKVPNYYLNFNYALLCFLFLILIGFFLPKNIPEELSLITYYKMVFSTPFNYYIFFIFSLGFGGIFFSIKQIKKESKTFSVLENIAKMKTIERNSLIYFSFVIFYYVVFFLVFFLSFFYLDHVHLRIHRLLQNYINIYGSIPDWIFSSFMGKPFLIKVYFLTIISLFIFLTTYPLIICFNSHVKRIFNRKSLNEIDKQILKAYVVVGIEPGIIAQQLYKPITVIENYLKKENQFSAYCAKLQETYEEKISKLSKITGKQFKTDFHKKYENLSNPKFVLKLIKHSENKTIEFKSTFLTDLYTNAANKDRAYDISKAMSGFLNAYGGYILIGVRDDKEVIGINNDNFVNKDKYILKMNNHIKKAMGVDALKFIHIDIVTLNRKFVCVIHCEPSTFPIYSYNKDRKKEFFVRSNNETIPYDIEQTLNYVKAHF